MVLSANGDHPMTKLSDTQAVILSAASQRGDGAVLPLPEPLKIKGGAVGKVLGSLKAKGLIDHQGAGGRPAGRHRRDVVRDRSPVHRRCGPGNRSRRCGPAGQA